MQVRRTLITLLAWTSLLGACTAGKQAVVAPDAPGIRTIYDKHMQEGGHEDLSGLRQSVQKNLPAHAIALDPATPLVASHRTRFARVPNPELIMYVYPHLAGPEQVPVPGYFTAFSMYARIHYARPGEARDPSSP